MCRIDAHFRNISLEEKTDPTERFIQALDESRVDGGFRSLLIKCFSDSWQLAFYDLDTLEEALAIVTEQCSGREQAMAFLLSPQIIADVRRQFTDSMLERHHGACMPHSHRPMLEFAGEVARQFYPESAYGFYSSGFGEAIGSCYRSTFVSAFFGTDFFLTREFFEDPELELLSDAGRRSVLLQFFELMIRNGSFDCPIYQQHRNLLGVSQAVVHQGPLSLANTNYLLGISFLKSWVKYDAQAGRLAGESETLLEYIDACWYYDLHGSVYSIHYVSDDRKELATLWLERTRLELQALYYQHADLTSASAPDTSRWAKGLDDHFGSFYRNRLSIEATLAEEFDAIKSRCLHELCSLLNDAQLSAWIRWSVSEDFKSLQKTGSPAPERSKKWWYSKHSQLSRSLFEEELRVVDAEDRLRVLATRLSYRDCESYPDISAWWDSLLSDLVKAEDFPKTLLPCWTIAANGRFPAELTTPYVNDSIGILRGMISKDRGPTPELEKELETLLQALDRALPEKSLRHRLQLMRSSKIPFSDASISRLRSLDSDQVGKWYAPFDLLANNRYVEQQYDARASRVAFDHDAAKYDCFQSVVSEIAEFCLSRLCLRRREKAKDGSYEAHQVVERSPVWRQGYLHALTELGVDLGGKVHKTMHFIKQSDPNEDVREVAKDCYKAVRRDSNKKRPLQDLKRALIAAEWWLLICQHVELNGPDSYDHVKAVKTRRRLLRNP